MSAAGNQNLFLSLFYDQALFMIKGILLLFSIDFPGKHQIALGKTPSPCNVGKKRNFPVQNPVSPDHFRMIPSVIGRIFQEAFGFRQVVAGGFGAVLMNGIKRGLFSNEAGSGSAPCAAATAETDHPAKVGLGQALGVFIDTILICSCTAMIMLLTPETLTQGLTGMDLLQEAMRYHLGTFGVVFIAITLWLFSFSTFVGILFYARSNVAYLFGDNWFSQTAYKIVALAMLFVGGLAAYTVVWDLGDVGVGLMTLFNIFILFPMSKKAIDALKDYEKKKKA